MKICSIPECGGKFQARGWCKKHHARVLRHGDPLALLRREPGTGGQDSLGYWRRVRDGKIVGQHVEVAERALGRRLPAGAVIHHVNENPSDNRPTNLVICPSTKYHSLLHLRMRALAACGNANWRKCVLCAQWDALENMSYRGKNQDYNHKACANLYQRERAARKAA